jgi:hypothetical protein
MKRQGRTAAACVAAAVSLFCTVAAASPPALPAGPVRLDVNVTWGTGDHDCDTPRPGSVICIQGKATITGLGDFQYARDGVPANATTADGCDEFSTQGTIFIAGGTADFYGTPATTCGGTDVPDAHYDYTIKSGSGILAGATGSGDIVADHGVDKWHGTLDAVGLHPKQSPSSSAPLVISFAVAVVLIGGVIAVVVVRRRRSTGDAPRELDAH